MKKSLRSLLLLAGMASCAAFGGNLALADDTPAAPAPAAHAAKEHRGGCEQGEHRGAKRHFGKLAKKLGLSDGQKVQLKAIFKENHAQAKPTLDRLQAERHQLRTLVQSGTADEAAIRAQSGKVSALQGDLAVQRAQGVKQMMALLTPEQQTKFKALQAQREQHPRKFGRHGAGHEGLQEV